MCKKLFDRIVIFVLVLVSTSLLSYLCFVLDSWIRTLDQPTCAEWAFFAYLEILFILLIISGWIVFITWNNYLDFEKRVVKIAYVILLCMGAATLYYLSDAPDADWLSGFLLSISVGLSTGLVIYFLNNKSIQDERDI